MRRNHLLIAGASILVLMFGACSDDDNGKQDSGPPVEAGADMDPAADGPITGDDISTPVGGNVCVATCTQDEQCGDNMHCLENGTCAMCIEDAHCEIAAYSGVFKGGCDETLHFCKMCSENAHCEIAAGVPMMTGVCHEASGQCLGCEEDTDCGGMGGNFAGCEGGLCVMCKEDADCEGNAAGENCVNNTCARCKSNADCADQAFKGCHVASGSCSLCTADEECAGDLECNVETGGCECDDASQCEDLYPDTALELTCVAL